MQTWKRVSLTILKSFLVSFVLVQFCAHADATSTPAEKQIRFNYKNGEITQMIEDYAKASGQKFIVDPSVRGKASILNGHEVSLEEAFADLSSALAINGIGISKQGNAMIVQPARAVQRNLIGMGTELPPPKPEQMFTWIITPKYISADEVNKQLRILTSKDGELVPFTPTNQLVVSDWVSNLYRIKQILDTLDRPQKK